MINEKKYYTKITKLPNKLMPNWVLVKLDILNKERKTKSGLYMASGQPDNILDTSEVFRQIDRYGTVVMTCDEVIFDPRVHAMYSLQWKTTMELQVNDVVWLRAMGAHDCERFSIDIDNGTEKYREYYKLIKYDEVIVAKRGDHIIPVNGWVLLKEYLTLHSNLVIAPEQNKNREYGIVKYMGVPNSDYLGNYQRNGSQDDVTNLNYWSDDRNIEVGQKIMHNFQQIFIESDYVTTFGEKLKICQRRHINAIVE